jgi:hypothetical protein
MNRLPLLGYEVGALVVAIGVAFVTYDIDHFHLPLGMQNAAAVAPVATAPAPSVSPTRKTESTPTKVGAE